MAHNDRRHVLNRSGDLGGFHHLKAGPHAELTASAAPGQRGVRLRRDVLDSSRSRGSLLLAALCESASVWADRADATCKRVRVGMLCSVFGLTCARFGWRELSESSRSIRCGLSHLGRSMCSRGSSSCRRRTPRSSCWPRSASSGALPERAWRIAIALTMPIRELLCQCERLLPAGEAMCTWLGWGKAIRA
jgi:hypothetical protein